MARFKSMLCVSICLLLALSLTLTLLLFPHVESSRRSQRAQPVQPSPPRSIRSESMLGLRQQIGRVWGRQLSRETLMQVSSQSSAGTTPSQPPRADSTWNLLAQEAVENPVQNPEILPGEKISPYLKPPFFPNRQHQPGSYGGTSSTAQYPELYPSPGGKPGSYPQPPRSGVPSSVNNPELHFDQNRQQVQTYLRLKSQVEANRQGLKPSPFAPLVVEEGQKVRPEDIPKRLRFLGSADKLADLLEATEGYTEALALRKEMQELSSATWSADHWRTINETMEVQHLQKIAAFNPAQRRELRQLLKTKQQMLELFAQGKYAAAIPLALTVMKESRRLLGVEDRQYAVSLHNLGTLYQRTGNYPEAKSYYAQTMEIRKRVLGQQHPSYAGSLNNLGGLCYNTGAFAEAESHYREALEVQKALFGETDPNYLATLNNLGLLYQRQGKLEQALPLIQESFQARTTTLGIRHPDTAHSRNNLASLYRTIGDYEQAESLFVENVRLAKMSVGEQHPDYARSIHNLAVLYEATGEYALAEPLYLQSIDIWTAALGKNHPDVAQSQVNLGMIQQRLGNFPRAEKLYLSALKIQQTTLGEQHPDYANTLNNLGYLYWTEKRYDEAKPVLERSSQLLLTAVGAQHPDYAACLDTLATVHRDTGEFPAAERLFQQAASITKERLGEQHPDYAIYQKNLGILYRKMGQFDRAEPVLLQSLQIREHSLSGQHLDVAESAFELAVLYQLQGKSTQAIEKYQQALEITADYLDVIAPILTEAQQLDLSQQMVERLDGLLTSLKDHPQQFSQAYAAVLRWKGAAMVRQRAIRRIACEPAIADQFTELQQVIRLWSTLVNAPLQAGGEELRQQRLGELRTKREALELNLSRHNAEFRKAAEVPSPSDIQQALPAATALIDYFEYVDTQPDPDNLGSLKKTRKLMGFIVQREQELVMIDLGPVSPLEKWVVQWRTSFGLTEDGENAGRALRRALLEPFAKLRNEADALLISPDGCLGRLSFAALPGREPGTWLLEDCPLAVVPVPRLLTAKREITRSKPSKDLLLMGGIDYNNRQQAATQPVQLAKSRFRGASTTLRNMTKGQVWPNLPGTQGEVAFIKSLYVDQLQIPSDLVTLLTNENATEEMFRKHAANCYVLHLATHGYFSEPDADEVAASRSDATHSRAGLEPGLLSGIVFAGANHPPEVPERSDAMLTDDGYLTADEISTLPLFGVKLVVLSACDTGLGEVAGGEGILGIQRAFQISGVDATIASYWKVDDTITRRLMEEFYKNYLVEGMSPRAALREAQLWVLRHPDQLRGAELEGANAANNDQPRQTSPRYWAAFSLSGFAE